MDKLKLLEIVEAKDDNVKKYIFRCLDDELIIEFSYINKGDGKDIICVPSQTMCKLACKFCHTTEYVDKIKTRNITRREIVNGVKYIYNNLRLDADPKMLLVSFMGCGEPMLNVDAVTFAMKDIETFYTTPTRFAVATCIPKYQWINFFKFTDNVKALKLNVKIHLSLHYTMDQVRREWMPAALDVIPSLAAVDYYKKLTGNKVEIHYALLEGVNDTEQDAILLTKLIEDKGFNVKFLFYNEKDSLAVKASPVEKIEVFGKHFVKHNIEYEYYIPPGLDIGSSCGAFLLGTYEKYVNV